MAEPQELRKRSEMNRRELLGMTSVGVLAVSLIGSRVFTGSGPKAAGGNFRIQFSDAQWQVKLSPDAYQVLRKGATEQPGSSPLLQEHRNGTFACAGCDTPIFASSTKYDSKTGWPSFWQTLPNATITRPDYTLARPRTELLCATCGGHLGHVFDDGPKPTGLRYCMNGVALAFHPASV
jgi:peptide-methionine (R)-S-oxide reductase